MANKHGFRKSKYELLTKRCRCCNQKFTTRDPLKEFCKDSCRVKNWARYNKDKIRVIQKRCRVKEEENLMKLVQEIKDSKGVQEN